MGAPHPIRVYQGVGNGSSVLWPLRRQSRQAICGGRAGRLAAMRQEVSSASSPATIHPFVELASTPPRQSMGSAACYALHGIVGCELRNLWRSTPPIIPAQASSLYPSTAAINVSGSNAVSERLRSLSDFCCFFVLRISRLTICRLLRFHRRSPHSLS